ncbi:Flagellar motor switch protein FliN [Nitrospira sp. KM1]|uniref:flagellar motor switch protein FliN n=1 Tax=Nitrospira sp. KM1 TaxID=1936990 RepID=UPI0013A7615A|nr:flagellar motor switch protein FliN [Nitrospira sp. KM1]BCA54807.1 Flagellar motor switch protein FliN [Nitrospira sp. KM1]
MANVDVSQQGAPAGAAPQSAQPASFPPVEKGGQAGAPNNLEFILDIPMQVTVQVGSARMLIREILQLGQGSVIELEKLAGEPMEVLVNNKLVAKGEVVVVNDKFGIRLTDVISAAQRVQQLG